MHGDIHKDAHADARGIAKSRGNVYLFKGLTHQMLHTKFQGNQPSGSGEDFFKVFTIYGIGSHLGHVSWTKYIKFLSPFARSLHLKFK